MIETEQYTDTYGTLLNQFNSEFKPLCSSTGTSTTEPKGDIIEVPIDPKNLKVGDKFNGDVKSMSTGKKTLTKGLFEVIEKSSKNIKVKHILTGKEFSSSPSGIKIRANHSAEVEKAEQEVDKKAKDELKKKFQKQARKEAIVMSGEAVKFTDLEPEEKLERTIAAGINNIWMVGPAGCGKSTMARNVANKIEIPYLCISCGIGTSAAEFIGYKYPQREATKFAEYYGKPSVILIDEFTALDPSVAQVVNAALANDEIETTTGLVKRDPNCIIIATSNTFGNGADRQYVANNQLDASTIDRFIGGIIEVDYSEAFESRYDAEVVMYVQELRKCIKQNNMRRVASTRMIQAGHNLKKNQFIDWKQRLTISWTDAEKEIVKVFNADFTNKYIEYRASELMKQYEAFLKQNMEKSA